MENQEVFRTTKEFRDKLRDMSVFLPVIPDTTVKDTYERMLEHESQLITGGKREPLMADYKDGTAKYPNEILLLSGDIGRPLLSAEHATDIIRKSTGKLGGADYGTASLAAIMHEDEGTTSIIPLGRQDANANYFIVHPLKDVIRDNIRDKIGYVSLHGMKPGKLLNYSDENEVHAVLGLGANPTEQSRDLAKKIIKNAKEDLGLDVMIGNDDKYMMSDPDTGLLKLNEDGSPARSTLAALGEGTTTNYVNNMGLAIPAIQLELTRGLRLDPKDFGEYSWHKNDKAREASVYAGYALTRLVVELTSEGK